MIGEVVDIKKLIELVRPPPFKSMVTRQEAAPDGTIRSVSQVESEYSFDQFVAEFAWAYPKFDTVEAWGEAQMSIGDKLETEGDVIRLTRFEMNCLVEAIEAAKFRGVYAHKLRRFQRAILLAGK